MDETTPPSAEVITTVNDGQEEITEDFRGGKKQKLDIEKESNVEKEQEICVGVEHKMEKKELLNEDIALLGDENQMESSSLLDERRDEDDVARRRFEDEEKNELRNIEDEVSDLKMVKKEMDVDIASSGDENQMESSSQPDERRDEDDDVARSINEEEEMNDLRQIEESYETPVWDDYYRKLEEEHEERNENKGLEWEEEEEIRFWEKQDKKEKVRGKGSQKQGKNKMEAILQDLMSPGLDVELIGKKKRDPQVGEKRKARHSYGAARLLGAELKIEETEPIESDEGMDESDKESEVKLLEGSSKECWDNSTDDENTSPKSLKKEVIPQEPKIKKSKPRSLKEKKDSVKLRSPVICVLGHGDTGKTKMLDFIRKTHVQDAEVGGITQQIGATMIPQEALREKCKMAKYFSSFDLKLPGLLVIDTPGHESFRNLRSRGTSLCDIAILVLDIMHGLKPQTIESINLLRDSKTPFIVALNKVDRLYEWKSFKDSDVESTVNSQDPATQKEFKKRCQEIIAQFAEENLNAALYCENPNPRTFVSMVPTSAISGDGMGNLLSLIARLTQTVMHKKLVFSEEFKATVMEVKAIHGLGTTVDVILVNGRLKEGDTIVMAGREGPVVGEIRSLLTPHPLKEMRVKNQYVEHKTIEGAQVVKITGKALEKSMAGLPLFVTRKRGDVKSLKEKVAALIEQAVSSIKTSERGVYVHASTLGSLEAFLDYLSSIDIPYFAVKIGPVHNKDVKKASAMLESDIQYATILAFDVKVEREAQKLADEKCVKVIPVDIIHHAGDEFLKHRELCLKEKEKALSEAVFPCICEVLLTTGEKSFQVIVEKGYLRVGAPLLCMNRNNLEVGVVKSISSVADESSVDIAKAGDKVKIQLKGTKGKVRVEEKEHLMSRIPRKSYKLFKKYCKKDFSNEEWNLALLGRNGFKSAN